MGKTKIDFSQKNVVGYVAPTSMKPFPTDQMYCHTLIFMAIWPIVSRSPYLTIVTNSSRIRIGSLILSISTGMPRHTYIFDRLPYSGQL